MTRELLLGPHDGYTWYSSYPVEGNITISYTDASKKDVVYVPLKDGKYIFREQAG